MSTDRSWLPVNRNTIRNELANVPRYDIDGRRYGNTLTDDMIAIKNPKIGNRHTPVSYDYLNDPLWGHEPAHIVPDVVTNMDLDHTYGDIHPSEGMVDKIGDPRINHGFLSRKKFISGEAPVVADHETNFTNPAEEDAMAAYHQAMYDKKALEDLQGNYPTGGSIVDDTRYIKSSGNTFHEPGRQLPRWDAEDDGINYNRLSNRVLDILAKDNVQRPDNEYISALIKLRRQYLGLE